MDPSNQSDRAERTAMGIAKVSLYWGWLVVAMAAIFAPVVVPVLVIGWAVSLLSSVMYLKGRDDSDASHRRGK